jgi:hypothetical protein
MDKVELSEYVVHRLSGGDEPEDIVYDLCEKAGWPWLEAEQFLEQIQIDREPEIARKQFPLMIVLAFGIFVCGLALIAYGVYSTIESWNTLMAIRALNLPHKSSPGTDITNFYAYLRMVLDVGLGPFMEVFIGTAMILGSLLGMRDAWAGVLTPQ